jgi:hypothetical protein
LTFYIVLLIVTGAAIAQDTEGLSISSWGRATFVPFQGVFPDNGDAKYLSGVGAGWKPAFFGLSFKYAALDGRVGGTADVSPGEGGLAQVNIGDNLNIWAKPFGSDILYIAVGKIIDGRFRGPSIDGNFQGFVGGPGKNGDAVFQRFAATAGALFVSQPISGLSIYAKLDPGVSMNRVIPVAGSEAKDVYKSIQAGFAYDISGIGQARAQWVGDTMDTVLWEEVNDKLPYDAKTNPRIWKGDNARIEAAFKLTAVEGLNLDLGIKIPIPVKKDTYFDNGTGLDVNQRVVFQDNFQIAVVGDFTAGDFGIIYGLYGAFGGSLAKDLDNYRRAKLNPTFDLLLIPSFYIAAIDATVGADVGFKVKGASTTGGVGSSPKRPDQSTTFGFGGWISRNLGKGLIKTGLAYQLPAYTDNGVSGSTSYFSWPIILELNF